jgi:hypothetical protein
MKGSRNGLCRRTAEALTKDEPSNSNHPFPSFEGDSHRPLHVPQYLRYCQHGIGTRTHFGGNHINQALTSKVPTYRVIAKELAAGSYNSALPKAPPSPWPPTISAVPSFSNVIL